MRMCGTQWKQDDFKLWSKTMCSFCYCKLCPENMNLKSGKNYSTRILTSADNFCGILMDNNALMCSLHYTATATKRTHTHEKSMNSFLIFEHKDWHLTQCQQKWRKNRIMKNKFENDNRSDVGVDNDIIYELGEMNGITKLFPIHQMRDKVRKNMINGFGVWWAHCCGQ